MFKTQFLLTYKFQNTLPSVHGETNKLLLNFSSCKQNIKFSLHQNRKEFALFHFLRFPLKTEYDFEGGKLNAAEIEEIKRDEEFHNKTASPDLFFL